MKLSMILAATTCAVVLAVSAPAQAGVASANLQGVNTAASTDTLVQKTTWRKHRRHWRSRGWKRHHRHHWHGDRHHRRWHKRYKHRNHHWRHSHRHSYWR